MIAWACGVDQDRGVVAHRRAFRDDRDPVAAVVEGQALPCVELDHDVLQSGRRDPVAQLGRGVARDDQAHRGRKAREQRQVEVVEVLVRDGDPVTVEDIRPA